MDPVLKRFLQHMKKRLQRIEGRCENIVRKRVSGMPYKTFRCCGDLRRFSCFHCDKFVLECKNCRNMKNGCFCNSMCEYEYYK